MSHPASAPPSTPPDFSRSEAFAEDLTDYTPGAMERRRPSRWLGRLHLLPVLVALVGVAFAVLPPA